VVMIFSLLAEGGNFVFRPLHWGWQLSVGTTAFNTICTTHFTLLWSEICHYV